MTVTTVNLINVLLLSSVATRSFWFKLVPVPVNLSKLSVVVKNYFIKKDVYNYKIKNIEDKIPDITNLATETTLNAKINVLKVKYLVLLT